MIAQFATVILNRHYKGFIIAISTYTCDTCYEINAIKGLRIRLLEFISCFVKKWYGHGCTSCYSSVLLNNIYIILLCFQLDTFYFDKPTYIAAEDDGFVLVNLTFSTELRHDTNVQFRYDDLTAIGKLLTCIYIHMLQIAEVHT